jgi:hypothetical protein
MKKLLSLAVLTVCALAITEHRADAWINSKFSIGLNWHLQSANNSWLWGAWKSGQVPGPEAFGGGGYGPMMQQAPAFPYFGSAPQGYPPTETSPPPRAAQQQAFYPQTSYYNPYQSVSYQTGGYYYPNNYYPVYNQYYGYQTPYYWYQGR